VFGEDARRVEWYEGGHTLALHTGGEQLFPAMVRAIGAARRDITLATYILHTDAWAMRIVDALIAAAARGVRVRVLIDGFGSARYVDALRAKLSGSAVSLLVFRPVNPWKAWRQPGQFRRLHPKLCAIDDNLVDDHIDVNHGATDMPRLDFAAEVRGPIVPAIRDTLNQFWEHASERVHWWRELVALVRGSDSLARLREALGRGPTAVAFRDTRTMIDPASHPMRVALVVRDNLGQRRAVERTYLRAIAQARDSIDLVCPYFYPARVFRRALVRAARRGVVVRLVLQGKIDYRIAALASRALYDELLSEGIHIHEYMPAYLHAKVAVIDDNWSTVGSSNIDPLSLLLNIEANLVVDDVGFSRQVRAAFESALEQSREVRATPGRSRWQVLLRRGAVSTLANWFLRVAGISGRY
jgi:cardiolipin synthase A/B